MRLHWFGNPFSADRARCEVVKSIVKFTNPFGAAFCFLFCFCFIRFFRVSGAGRGSDEWKVNVGKNGVSRKSKRKVVVGILRTVSLCEEAFFAGDVFDFPNITEMIGLDWFRGAIGIVLFMVVSIITCNSGTTLEITLMCPM